MSFKEILKKIRIGEKDSYRTLARKSGIVHSYLDKIERGVSPVNSKILEKLIEVYPQHKKELIAAYCETTIPKFVLDTISDSALIPDGTIDIFKSEIKMFSVVSNTDGELLPNYEIKEMSTTVELKNNEFCIEIKGNEMGKFCDGDIILVEKTEKPWQLLNKQIVIIEIGRKQYIRRVIIKDYEPTFESVNELYPPLIEKKVKLIGVVTKLLQRNLSNF